MKLWAAIDLMGGEAVTLVQGRSEAKTVWKGTPVDYATKWQAEGADGIHLVDLDAAFASGNNDNVVSEIVGAVEIPVELGGGIRTPQLAHKWLDAGISRVVVGTMAYREPKGLQELLAADGAQKVVVAADYRDGNVVVKGWKEKEGLSVFATAKRLEEAGVANLLATSVGRDGMSSGPDVDTIRKLSADSAMDIVASGGIRHLEDLVALERAGANGAVVGRALYEGGVKLADFERRDF